MESAPQPSGHITGPNLHRLWLQVEAMLAHLSLFNLRVQALERQVSDLVGQVNRHTELLQVLLPFEQVREVRLEDQGNDPAGLSGDSTA